MVILKIPSLLQHPSFLEVSLCRMVEMIETDAPMLSTFIYVGPPIKISSGDSSMVKNMDVSSSSYSGIVQFARTRLPSVTSNLQTLTLSTYIEACSTYLPNSPSEYLSYWKRQFQRLRLLLSRFFSRSFSCLLVFQLVCR